MATIQRKNNGSYLITVSCGYDSNGKQKRAREVYKPVATTEAKVKKELDKEVIRFEEECKHCGFDGARTTFGKYYEDKWLPWGRTHLTARALLDYTHHIETRALPSLSDKKLVNIKSGDIREIIEKMVADGLAIGTQRKCVTALNSVFSLAWSDDVIQINPVAKAKVMIERDENKGEIKSFTIEQTKQFLAFLDEDFYTVHRASQQVRGGVTVDIAEYKEKHSIDAMWKAYFYTALFSGCRRGEELELRWTDIDFENNMIVIDKATSSVNGQRFTKDTKTKAGVRSFSLSATCIDRLKAWKVEQMERSLQLGTYWKGYRGKDFDKNYIFVKADGSPMAVDSPRQALERIINRYNEAHEEKLPELTLHQLRHTCGSMLVALGNDIATVSARLGHSNPAVTLRYYVHSDATKDSEASDSLTSALG